MLTRLRVPVVLNRVLACLLAGVALSACGSGGGGADHTPSSGPPSQTATVAGVAGKGLLLNAIVNFYAVMNGTASTTSLATVRTDGKTGAFSSSVTSSGPVLVTVTTDSNTTMLDELTGSAIPAPSGLSLHALLDSLTNVQPIAVTPLTEMVYSLANAASGGLTPTNIDAAATAVDTAFLNGAPALTTQPIDITKYKSVPAAQQQLSKLLVALAVAANEGTATDSAGAACSTGNYDQRLVCMIGGLGALLKLDSSNNVTLAAAANYIGAAYAQIDAGAVTVAGGQSPSVLGLDATTQAETGLETALAKQHSVPGYDSGASPLANTKALFADIRTNILDQSTTQTFGLAPIANGISTDFNTNVRPALGNTAAALAAMKTAADLLVAAGKNTGAGTTVDMNTPAGIALDGAGNLNVVDYADELVLTVSQSGNVTPLAGTAWKTGSQDGTGAAASFNSPAAVAVDSKSGFIYVADTNNSIIRKITPDGTVTTFAGQAGVTGSADGTGTAAMFNSPYGIAVDAAGSVYVADTVNFTIRKITSAGVVTTIAGQPGVAGHVDGTGAGAQFRLVAGITVDALGNVYVSELASQTIRKITSAGVVTTIAGEVGVKGSADGTGSAASFNSPWGLAADGAGNVYVADAGNSTIRKVTPAGVVTTIAGQAGVPGSADGNGSAARFYSPNGVTVDQSGNLFVADTGNNSIRKIDTSGNVTTVAQSTVSYRQSSVGAYCGYDPTLLQTSNTAALCRYGGYGSQMLMTVTQTATGTFDVKTQPLSGAPSSNLQPGQNPVLDGYTVSTASPALDASYTVAGGAGSAPTWAVNGPIYVTGGGGQLTLALSLGLSSDWNFSTNTGTATVTGTLSGGSGGISLKSATLASDTSLVLDNFENIGSTLKLLASNPAGIQAAPSIQGTLDVSDVTTSAFTYAAKFVIGAPTNDKSGKLGIAASISLSGSIAQIAADGSKQPLFTGDVSVSIQGAASFDATQPISATNFVTVQAQVSGDLTLTGGRVLSLSATVNASQTTPTPTQPDSFTVTYSYATPSGTALLNASGQYDATNGYSGTITNNGGVSVTVSRGVAGGSLLKATVTDNGQETATVAGSTISYSDGTTESLF